MEERINRKLIEIRINNHIEILEKLDIDESLKKCLKEMLINRLVNKEFYKINFNEKENAILAYSGGVDSSVSLIIAKHLFNVKPITCYSPYIIKDKDVILKRAKKLGFNVEFINVDLEDVYKGTVEGRFHPCGRCHKIIEEVIVEKAIEEGIEYIIFGDLLAFGHLSFYKDRVYRLNLPSFFALTKNEEREILKKYGIEIKDKYGCPMLNEFHKIRGCKFTIQRILREVRARVIDYKEGARIIEEILNDRFPI
ncbi:Queuosine synthesis-like protein [Methanocaldococcus villosus KIN24-T80]|uniref:Queuosine synthesis-like protein n=1 Tax=Methanocaldococcus villosus KIN24-T80 TaxID=1069083 RepID=N6VXC0_9EURY|nr:hypothetical protein [Methanocaldococcus villosus]ENN95772.1 Queuosine synthesis-like protein [Methanocaldococcus villosus KIN24-T80]